MIITLAFLLPTPSSTDHLPTLSFHLQESQSHSCDPTQAYQLPHFSSPTHCLSTSETKIKYPC